MHQSKNPCPAMPAVVALLAAAMFFMAGCIGKTVPGVTSPETADNAILLATGTSVYDSGLLEFLNQVFTAQTGIEVRVASQGTGAALESGRRGDVDVVLVHDRITELILVEAGYFVDRYDVIYNDFILVGPASDPAGVRNAVDVFDAFNLIARSEYPFISRGDDSGANRKELRLWAGVGINPKNADWYFSIGQGMGETLLVANEKLGYTLTDRGTFIALRNNLALVIIREGDPVLLNQYGVMAVNPKLHPHVRYEQALQYIHFLTSAETQTLIEAFRIDGETLFFPGLGVEE